MLKKARLLTRPTPASEEAKRTLRYVEPLSEARTTLVDFFSILREPRHCSMFGRIDTKSGGDLVIDVHGSLAWNSHGRLLAR